MDTDKNFVKTVTRIAAKQSKWDAVKDILTREDMYIDNEFIQCLLIHATNQNNDEILEWIKNYLSRLQDNQIVE